MQHRATITDEKRLGGLLTGIDGYDGWPTLRCALQFVALTFARPGEVRGAVWDEIDLENAVWHIDGKRTKVRRPHDVPLSREVVEVLREVKQVARASPLVFPSIRSNARPLSENAMNAALRRLGYTQDEMTAHGFRATALTLLNESSQWNADAIERQLAHEDAIRRAYARGEHWEERVRMMQWWADKLEAWKGEG